MKLKSTQGQQEMICLVAICTRYLKLQLRQRQYRLPKSTLKTPRQQLEGCCMNALSKVLISKLGVQTFNSSFQLAE